MRWSMLPVSIVAHSIAAIAVVIIPLAADAERPVPAPLHPLMVTTKVVPVPSEVVMRTGALPRRVVIPAPATAASSIEREADVPPDIGGTAPPGPPIEGATNGLAIGTSTPITPPPPAPLPQAVEPARTVRAGQGVREPRRIVDVRPVYPPLARAAKIEGVVILEAVINEQGVVEQVKVLRSVPLLDAAAVEAVRAWRYTPTLLNGSPVSVLMTITVNFRIGG